MKKILNHFNWSNWESIGEQFDNYKKKRYEVFKSENKNGLARYKKVLIVSASCYHTDLTIIFK